MPERKSLMKHQRNKGAGQQGYVLTLVPEPGTDAIRELRWALKGLLRRHHLRCTDLRAANDINEASSLPIKEAG
jgi:hypothetical protein